MPKTPNNSHPLGKEPPKGKCIPFEEAVNFYIEDETDKKRALDFAEWLRKNKLSPSAGNNGYNWYVKFHYIEHGVMKNDKYHRRTYHGAYIKLFNSTWHILPSKDILEQILLRDDIKEMIWDSLFRCHGCNYGCYKHTRDLKNSKMLFGREIFIKGLCLHQPICFTNPNGKLLDVIKEILILIPF